MKAISDYYELIFLQPFIRKAVVVDNQSEDCFDIGETIDVIPQSGIVLNGLDIRHIDESDYELICPIPDYQKPEKPL